MITLLAPGHLITPLPASTPTATMHRACLMRDEYDKPVHVHLKLPPPTSKALANEALGHACLLAANIPTASRAWFAILDAHELAAVWPDHHWPPGTQHVCWATEHLDATPLSAHSAWAYSDELAVWHDIAALIALHEWLANSDGNAGNLLWSPPGDFWAIDHGEILGGADWTADTLQDRQQRPFNKLLHIAYGGLATPAQLTEIRHAATKHAGILKKAWPQVQDWWKILTKKKEIDAAWAFLSARSTAGWINTRL